MGSDRKAPKRRVFPVAAALAAVCAAPSVAWSQAADPQPTPRQEETASRPATTTFFGDTGLWFVPSAEVLPRGRWSFSGYRRGTNFAQGFQNVSDVAGTFAVGIRDRVELFGSFLFVTRIDRDLRPVFDAGNVDVGGLAARHPRSTAYWSGNRLGDLYLGAKVNLRSPSRGGPDDIALALRGIVKVPTGDDTRGASTGRPDGSVDVVASREVAGAIDLAGYLGAELRGSPDGIDVPGAGFRWGGGAAFPSRRSLRFVTEVDGTVTADNRVTVGGGRLVGIDGSVPPSSSTAPNLTRAMAGVNWHHSSGLFVGVGGGWNFPTRDRSRFGTDERSRTDFLDWQVRIGYHPGVRQHVARVPPPPPPPLPPPNRPPTVTARCEPCTVEVGAVATVTANGADPDGDPLTYRWSAPSGALSSPTDAQTPWRAPDQPGPVPLTVTVDDGRGATASATVTIQVVRPPVKEFTFEDVHFDFDRYSLRPEAARMLGEAAEALKQNPTLRLVIEGHTCNIGTAEYNLALGDRRATAVRDYLGSLGIDGSRLRTISYGEERPKHDNVREETRRLNRRAALVVSLQP